MKVALFIPGIGDDETIAKQAHVVGKWNSKQVRSECFLPKWDTNEPYEDKLQRLLDQFDSLGSDDVYISAASGGGPLAIRLLQKRNLQIKEVKTVSGKLRGSKTIGPHYQKLAPQLQQAVIASEDVIPRLSQDMLGKITNYYPLFDGVVQKQDMLLEGVRHRRLFTLGHAFSIAFSLIFILKP